MKANQKKQSSFVRLSLLMKPYMGKLLICVVCVIL